MKRNLRPGIKSIIIHYTIFVTLVVTIELIGQIGYRLAKGKWIAEEPLKNPFKDHPYRVGSLKENFIIGDNNHTIELTTDSNGFRITSKQQSSLLPRKNVICLGGSTTYGTYVTDQDSWPYQLQTALGEGYQVYNLGVPGYSTMEAIVQLTTIVPELNPDIIIVYGGWNDIRNYHCVSPSPDYAWHGMSQKKNLQLEPKTFYESFFWALLARKLHQIVLPESSEQPESFTTNDPYVDSLYVRNLKTINTLSHQFGATCIFVPQILNEKAFLDLPLQSDMWTPTIQNKAMPALMTKFNGLMSLAATKDSRTIVLDSIVVENPWQSQHFVDNGHFSREGGELFAKILMKAIARE